MNALSALPASMFDIIRRMGTAAVTAREIGTEGAVMLSLVKRGFLLADTDGSPTIYRLSPMGHGAHAVLTSPAMPRDNEGPIARIQRVVANYYSIPVAEMTSERRGREIARPRQIAMYLCRHLTPHSFPTIGKHFGGRDHTTVMHALRQIEGLVEINHNNIHRDIEDLLRILDAPEAIAA